MGQLHAIGASAVVGAIILTGLAATIFALRGGSPWVDRLRLALTGLIGLQVLVGAFVLIGGGRPAESLHLLYGAVGLIVLPAVGSFATEAPPPDRAWVLVAACGILLLLAWRLASTG
jgi:hypothetical protein